MDRSIHGSMTDMRNAIHASSCRVRAFRLTDCEAFRLATELADTWGRSASNAFALYMKIKSNTATFQGIPINVRVKRVNIPELKSVGM